MLERIERKEKKMYSGKISSSLFFKE